MESFKKITARAAKRHGGPAVFAAKLKAEVPTPATKRKLTTTGDDRYLALMAKCVFRAGFVWRVVGEKWSEFARAYQKIDPQTVVRLSDEALDHLAQDDRIIRHRRKVYSVRHNAAFVRQIAREHESFGKFLAQWPTDDPAGLALYLKKHGDRLGGHTGVYFARYAGRDTFVLTPDVIAACVHQGVVKKEPTSAKALRELQDAMLQWQSESGVSLATISKTLACSIDA